MILVLIVVLGGLTVCLQDGQFSKWNPTIVCWLFGLGFLGSQFIGKKPVVQRLMEKGVELPSRIWRQLNLAWVVFFAAMGSINYPAAPIMLASQGRAMGVDDARSAGGCLC